MLKERWWKPWHSSAWCDPIFSICRSNRVTFTSTELIRLYDDSLQKAVYPTVNRILSAFSISQNVCSPHISGMTERKGAESNGKKRKRVHICRFIDWIYVAWNEYRIIYVTFDQRLSAFVLRYLSPSAFHVTCNFHKIEIHAIWY